MSALYALSISLYTFFIRLAAPFNRKASLWVNGRKNIFLQIGNAEVLNKPGKRVWIHCASLGEFEQGRPLIEELKRRNGDVLIILTFFSPSGYEIRKNYSGADLILYLPADTRSNAFRFVDLIKPDIAIFIKYEFWFNYLNALHDRDVKVFLASGIFRPSQHFFSWYGAWFQKQLSHFTYFFLQDRRSAELLRSIGYSNSIVCGDTRFDRVMQIVESRKDVSLAAAFSAGHYTIVAGSSWPDDEKYLAEATKDISCKIIIAPHEITPQHLGSIPEHFRDRSVLFLSRATLENVKQADVLVIDNIGMLSSLYQYGAVAYVGGGFGKGIHNILEAATYGMPVIFGPKHQKFNEAVELIGRGGAFVVTSAEDLLKALSKLKDDAVREPSAAAAAAYVRGRTGASLVILDHILK